MLEGFLCPLCMKDLGDVIQLQVVTIHLRPVSLIKILFQLHFDEAHPKEDQAFVQNLKDFFGKAKRILSDETDLSTTVTQPKLKLAPSQDDDCHPVSGIRRDIFQPLDPSCLSSQSHFAEFKKIRSSRVDRFATETNRLIVRLDRLLENMPGEAGKRREHERNIVTWIDEDLVKLCPTCARSFNIARRKHHCRLCGSVMCQDCSQFVDFNFCRRLTNPASLSSYKTASLESRPGWSVNTRHDTRSVGSPSSTKSGLFKLRRSGSRESLGSSVMGGIMLEGRLKEEFRACGYCKSLLSHRDTMMELAMAEPIIAQFYVKLREHMELGEKMSPQYLQMYDSLMAGDNTYHSSDAKMLRVKLLKVAENIDMMSKKIQALGVETLPEDREGQPLPRRFLLQNQVRRAAVNFIKETLVGLPSLPSDSELETIRERKKEEIARRVQEERKKQEEARLKYQILQERRRSDTPGKLKQSPSGSKFNQSSVSYDSGFVLSSNNQQREIVTGVTDDPMLQQIQIIRGYIAQARQQNRFDEVHMLETNLQMLQEELRKQTITEEAKPDSSNYVSFQSKPELDIVNGRPVISDNPFKSDDSDEEYDASGKNPFSE